MLLSIKTFLEKKSHQYFYWHLNLGIESIMAIHPTEKFNCMNFFKKINKKQSKCSPINEFSYSFQPPYFELQNQACRAWFLVLHYVLSIYIHIMYYGAHTNPKTSSLSCIVLSFFSSLNEILKVVQKNVSNLYPKLVVGDMKAASNFMIDVPQDHLPTCSAQQGMLFYLLLSFIFSSRRNSQKYV